MARVAVVRTGRGEEELASAVRRSIELTGGLAGIVGPGARVLIKPNVVAPLPRGVTSFTVLRTVIEMVRAAGGAPFIGDCAGIEFNSDKTFELLGYDEFARRMNVELVNFDHDESVYLPVRLGVVRRLAVPRSAAEADVMINLPRLKRHGLTTVTLGVKNLMGVASKKARRRIHVFGLHRGIAWLSKLVRSHLTIIDGTTAVERPVFGRERALNILLASRDVVAADKIACRFLGIDPRLVTHIRRAEAMGLGGREIELIGDVEQVPAEEGTDGRLNFRSRMRRGAYWCAFAADLAYHRITGKSLLPWAHVRFGSHPVLDRRECDRCGRCVEVCPVGAIDMERLRINYRLCREVRCMRCYEACSRRAIQIKGVQRVRMDGDES